MRVPRPFCLSPVLALALLATAWGDPGAGKAPAREHKGATDLPGPATRPVTFASDIQPLLETSCIKCHGRGKDKGGFSIETRESFLKGGETGAGAVIGKSGESLVVQMVAASDPDELMPKKGTQWTREQVGLLRAWIDQGMVWPREITFKKALPQNLHPRKVALPEGLAGNPVDRLLSTYYAGNKWQPPARSDDAVFARRVHLDITGLLPTPEQLSTFASDNSAGKRAALVRALLADNRNYADHWLTFWNDLLRNDYKGTGFIDGGRKQITGWLYSALLTNLPYDQFVSQLVAPTPSSEGFTTGILWRGNVNASMTPPMQAAQSVSQVFLGVNLKCASCHDSFVNDWSLADAYGMAAVYSEDKMELVHCDKPTGKQATARYIYPELGTIDPGAARADRVQRLASIVTGSANGRIARTIVNRFWGRLFGRGLVEPIDDMDQAAWNPDVLDWLAEDLIAHGYDLKRTLEVILTSEAYQLPSVEAADEKEPYVFRGPLVRRMTAEQFCDALSSLTGDWPRLPSSLEFDFDAGAGTQRKPDWIWTSEPAVLGPQRETARRLRGELDAVAEKLAAARKLSDEAAGSGAADLNATKLAVDQAAAALSATQEKVRAATAAQTDPAATSNPERHKVVFRKRFTLSGVPAKAYGAVAASQAFQVYINGQEAKPALRDGARNSRIVLMDLKPLLVAGDNVVTVDVSSHTEKPGLNDPEKKEHPASLAHLNARSGLAFYAKIESAGASGAQEWISDASWRVRRSPEGDWKSQVAADTHWALGVALAPDQPPIDEGPGLLPLRRKDFANIPVDLGPQLQPAVSTAAHAGRMRTALLAADPLQVALDRPNREVIVPARATTATMLQALELTNGAALDGRLKAAAGTLAPAARDNAMPWLNRFYNHAVSRRPSENEERVAAELFGTEVSKEAMEDFLWSVVNSPEFQLVQ